MRVNVFLSTEQSLVSTDERTFRCPWECLQHANCILFGCADSGGAAGLDGIARDKYATCSGGAAAMFAGYSAIA